MTVVKLFVCWDTPGNGYVSSVVRCIQKDYYMRVGWTVYIHTIVAGYDVA